MGIIKIIIKEWESKVDIPLIICAIGVLITTIYLSTKLYGVEKLAWGLWGLFIFIGTIISQNAKKHNRRRSQ